MFCSSDIYEAPYHYVPGSSQTWEHVYIVEQITKVSAYRQTLNEQVHE